jgi:uncharacterized protein (DUF1800 family)
VIMRRHGNGNRPDVSIRSCGGKRAAVSRHAARQHPAQIRRRPAPQRAGVAARGGCSISARRFQPLRRSRLPADVGRSGAEKEFGIIELFTAAVAVSRRAVRVLTSRCRAGRFATTLFACFLLVALCRPAHAIDADAQVLHVLNRLAFGPNAEDFSHVKDIGIDRYIAEQLSPDDIDEPIELRFRLAQLPTVSLSAAELRQLYGPLPAQAGAQPSLDDLKAQQQRASLVLREAAEARLWRALFSRRQLQQVMVNFWFNHFNVFPGEGLGRIWIGNYEDEAIRPYALGRFRDLLVAVAKHPAMLVYLDNTQNTASASAGRDRLNENFAREVMELHTLGADGGYTQQDVESLARVFTGWRVNSADGGAYPGIAAVFERARHDYRPKILLGHALDARGKAEGEEALAMLAASPATAHHIAYELAQYFVEDAPPAELVDRLATVFLATAGDIRAVLKQLFESPEFWASAGQKYKTPYEFVISAARGAGVPINTVRPLLGWIARLGMPVYGCETPDGYKNTAEAWLSPQATMQRIAFAAVFGRGDVPVAADSEAGRAVTPPPRQPIDARRLEALIGAGLSSATRAVVAEAPAPDRAVLILGSPDFMAQ